MININTTENNLGITISGDFNDLDELHKALSNLTGYEGEIKGYDGVSLRILGICYDLRHAYMGDREIETVDNGMNDDLKRWHGKLYPNFNVYYSVNILWIEAIFSILVLEDLINIATDNKLSKKHVNKGSDFGFGGADKESILEQVKIERELRLPYDISIIRMYQAAIWKALGEVVGINRYRRIKKSLTDDDYIYYLPLKYNGFCTQYIDILNDKYIYTNSEKRITLLASTIRKLIKLDNEYYDIENDIKQYAKQNNISYVDVRLGNIDYPEDMEW